MRWWGDPEKNLAVLAKRPAGTDALILADGAAVGYLCWQRPTPEELGAAGLADLPGALVDIDILIGDPAFLGSGIGPQALALLLAKLRDDGATDAGLATSLLNRAAARAFEKAGFRLFREFDDPEYGPCRYMAEQLGGATG